MFEALNLLHLKWPGYFRLSAQRGVHLALRTLRVWKQVLRNPHALRKHPFSLPAAHQQSTQNLRFQPEMGKSAGQLLLFTCAGCNHLRKLPSTSVETTTPPRLAACARLASRPSRAACAGAGRQLAAPAAMKCKDHALLHSNDTLDESSGYDAIRGGCFCSMLQNEPNMLHML